MKTQKGKSRSKNKPTFPHLVSLRLEEKEAERRKIQGQIVNSPEKFRKQISDVAQSLLAEQTDCKSFEKKSRELSSWQTAAEDALASINVSIVLF